MATSVVEVGGKGGQHFYFNGMDKGSLLKKIQVWEGDSQINSVAVWLTDDRSKEFGESAGNLEEFAFDDDEIFASLSLWPNQDGTHLGAIKFKTSNSREFYACVTSDKLQPEVVVDVESGKCPGIQGCSGADIDRFGFIMLKKKSAA
ncbi:aerolysin-like protein [Tachysurus vachellii]|uniref:aerolysin-like protein n=1 Tax=Tachysurus vachellii TaxID=175792 RepID=UPI00296B1665|nr:aerolysin-like protein [Tachysurus vachellii]XP_060748882.1 aerolysin-like protein [Tachysurus vachellii]